MGPVIHVQMKRVVQVMRIEITDARVTFRPTALYTSTTTEVQAEARAALREQGAGCLVLDSDGELRLGWPYLAQFFVPEWAGEDWQPDYNREVRTLATRYVSVKEHS